MIVSRLMGDSPLQTFRMTILIPLLGTLATSFIQTFFLCLTDFGIPASVGGQYEVVASVLYARRCSEASRTSATARSWRWS